MKVTEAFKKEKPTISFEFFPPKTPEQEAHLFAAINQLKKFRPDFVSITYGAMGTTREKTFSWADKLKNQFGLEPVAHLTCVAASREDISSQLNQIERLGIENILALRGDPPAGEKDFIPPKNGFSFAKELVAYIKQQHPAFCLGVAGFPERGNIEFLKQKVDAGADYIITQLFFDNRFFLEFVTNCRKAGINIPILAGLMPITSLRQVKMFTETCGATLPHPLLDNLEKHANDHEAVKRIGAEYALAQAKALLTAGIHGLHFFVMNQSEPISTILASL